MAGVTGEDPRNCALDVACRCDIIDLCSDVRQRRYDKIRGGALECSREAEVVTMDNNEHRRRIFAGIVFFLSLSFLSSWFIAATFRIVGLNVSPPPLGTRLLSTSLLYVATLGWQPLVAAWAVRRWVDPPDHPDFGLRPAQRKYSIAAVVSAVVLAGAATGATFWASNVGVIAGGTLNGTAEWELTSDPVSMPRLITLFAILCAVVVVVSAQAFAEEVGWRGYFLNRAMTQFGRWNGLLLHGLVWGCWYAPVLILTTDSRVAFTVSLVRGAAFLVTCVLLGILLGWLRLASRSLVPAVVANSTLTLAAGLPYFVHGVDAGMRSAIFGPMGWLVLGLTILVLMLSDYRRLVQIPKPVVEFEDLHGLTAGRAETAWFGPSHLH